MQSMLDFLPLCLELTLHTAGFLQCPQTPTYTVLQQNRWSQESQLLCESYSENKSKMSTQSFMPSTVKAICSGIIDGLELYVTPFCRQIICNII